VEKSPSEEAQSSSAGREFPCPLWNMNVHYHVNKSPARALILSQMNSPHAPSHAIYLSSVLILFPLLFLHFPSCLIPSVCQTLHALLLSLSMPHVHPNHRNITSSAATTDPITVSQQKFLPKFPHITAQQLPHNCSDRRWAGLKWRDPRQCN